MVAPRIAWMEGLWTQLNDELHKCYTMFKIPHQQHMVAICIIIQPQLKATKYFRMKIFHIYKSFGTTYWYIILSPWNILGTTYTWYFSLVTPGFTFIYICNAPKIPVTNILLKDFSKAHKYPDFKCQAYHTPGG